MSLLASSAHCAPRPRRSAPSLSKPGNLLLAELRIAEVGNRDQEAGTRDSHVIGPNACAARGSLDVAAGDDNRRVPHHAARALAGTRVEALLPITVERVG